MRVVHESGAREYVSGAREYMGGAREYVSGAREKHESSAQEYVSEVKANFSRLGQNGPSRANFSRLGMEPPEQTLVDWAWNRQDKLLSTGHVTSRANSSRLGMGPPGEAQTILIQGSIGNRRIAALPRKSRDWRGEAVVEEGAEVIMNLLAEVGLLIYPGAGSL